MNDYVIYTDSACDISPEVLSEWGVCSVAMTFMFDDFKIECSNHGMNVPAFYRRMREGAVATTSAVNSESFRAEFEDVLQQGKDLLYIGFSSGLSSTYNAACVAARDLKRAYPQRKILTVDSLSGSAGQGLLLYLTAEQKKRGATLEQAARYAADMRLRICHLITVDDLVYLRRGGRIGGAAAFVAGVLGIKPLLRVSREGKLFCANKVRGRKKALESMIEQYGERAAQISDGTVFIAHADCKSDAAYLAERLRIRYNAVVRVLTDIGPVVGAHGGPGALALFFVEKSERKI